MERCMDHHEYCTTEDFDPDDIVISGVAGRFVKCDSVGELEEALFAKKDLFTVEDYGKIRCGTLSGVATVRNVDKFDADYFCYPYDEANILDPETRMGLEVTYEAIADAGYDPYFLRGANIGVYCGVVYHDRMHILANSENLPLFSWARSMKGQHISYAFDFKGPTIIEDSACSTTASSLWTAINDLKAGRVDAAVVNGAQLNFFPIISKLYVECGITSPTGNCIPFDDSSDGMIRGESVATLFLQKASFARRAYVKIAGSNFITVGYNPEGLSVPSMPTLLKCMKNVLEQSGVNPNDIDFIESHGTGTPVGDPIELDAIANAFSVNNRTKPLFIGAIKSSVGHTEAVSGICGILKAIICCETGRIPPHVHFFKPNHLCKTLEEGKLKIVTETIPLTSPFVPVNSFGICGTVVHIILKQNSKVLPKTEEKNCLPKFVLYPATTESAVQLVFDYIKNNENLSDEFFALLHKLSFCPTYLKPIRGYAFFQEKNNPVIAIKPAELKKQEVWFICNGAGSQWRGMGLHLMEIDIYAESMRKSANTLMQYNIDLFEILNPDEDILEIEGRVTPVFVAIVSIGIALIDLLISLGIHPNGIIGHSLGEIVAAYADGCITAEEAIKITYIQGSITDTVDTLNGALYAVGLTWKEALERCPENVFPACHNAEDSITIAGYKKELFEFVRKLKEEDVFCRPVPTNGYAFHCPIASSVVPRFVKEFSEVLKYPKQRSEKWISTSYLEHEWEDAKVKIVGPEYFANNIQSQVYFKEATDKIPKNAIVLEVGPQSLLQSILKRNLDPGSKCYGLTKKNEPNGLNHFFNTIGELYIEGLEPKVEKLYPPVKFPVSRGTPRISDLIKWNHSISYDVPCWNPCQTIATRKFLIVKEDKYLLDHHIDGRSLFPAAGYIYLVWESLAKLLKKDLNSFPVVIENMKIYRATIINAACNVSFDVNILNKSGSFEIINDNAVVVTGTVSEWKDTTFVSKDTTYIHNNFSIPGADIYNELKMIGYEYGPAFQGLLEVNMNENQSLVLWEDRWISFLDSAALFSVVMTNTGDFQLPIGFQSIKINPNVFNQYLKQTKGEQREGIPFNYNPATRIFHSYGVEITNMMTNVAPRRAISVHPTLEEYKFVPYLSKYFSSNHSDIQMYMIACNKMLNSLGHALNIEVQNYKFSIEETNINMEDYLKNLSGKHCILKCLKELLEQPNRGKECISYFGIIGNDVLNCVMTCEYALRIILEIVTENSYRKLNVVELNNSKFPVVLPFINEIIKKYSILKCNSKVLISSGTNQTDLKEFNEQGIIQISEDSLATLSKEKEKDLAIGSFMGGSCGELENLVNKLSSILKSTGFILLYFKEKLLPIEKLLLNLSGRQFQIQPTSVLESILKKKHLNVISKITDDLGTSLYLLRPLKPINPYKIINIVHDNFNWVEELKNAMASDSSDSLWLKGDDSEINGIVGLVNCLKQEPKGDRIRCIFLPSEVKNGRPPFNFENPYYKEILAKNLVMNIMKNGEWGSYRHILLNDKKKLKKVEHSYVTCRKFGDLSSFEWVESFNKYSGTTSPLVHIYYSALNFKDVMLATGKLSSETSFTNPNKVDDSILGLEFSGKDQQGNRVAGIVSGSGIATSVNVDPLLLLNVPDNWSLEDAATVPIVYATCYYALLVRAQLQKGEKILIHSGTGGIGIAAINIALSLQCEIFVTVGNDEKKKWLRQLFPEIKEENISCSRNALFQNTIKKRTKGNGVDVVLNSLADDKFQASIRCLAKHGRFVEIGKYDLSLDRSIGLKMFLENVTFHGVFLDKLFENTPSDRETLHYVMQLVRDGIKHNVVKPLVKTVFKINEVEEAFRYMAKGIHVGKIVLKIREEECDKQALPNILSQLAVPITYFYPSKLYIVIGGLGGFGIEVTKWILSRGGHNIILTSRHGPRTPYHNLCIQRWKKRANVKIVTLDASKESEAEKLLQEAEKIAPVGGIFNSAVVLQDSFFDSQTVKKFEIACGPKALASKHLDTLSRKICPSLDYFICFSSISCGVGNAGQTNYGYANSVMERICERRREAGFHGLAIQWGIIGEVGLVHRHMGDDAMIAGVSAQNVKSCLEALDLFCHVSYPVVSSYIPAAVTKTSDEVDVTAQISKILGMKDACTSTRTFAEMGLDSLIGVEVKQLLETAFDIPLTMNELLELRMSDVKIMTPKAVNEKVSLVIPITDIKLPLTFIHAEPLVSLNAKSNATPIFIIHIGDTDIKDIHLLAQNIHNPVYALLWTKSASKENMKSLATWYLNVINSKIQGHFHLIGYSLGGSLAFEMALMSENSTSNVKSITLLDGSSDLLRNLNEEKKTENQDVSALCNFVEQFSSETLDQLKSELLKMENLDKMVEKLIHFITSSSTENISKSELYEGISEYLKKTRIVNAYLPSKKLSSDINLIEDSTQIFANDVCEIKSRFSEVCSGKIEIHRLLFKNELSKKDTIQQLLTVLRQCLQ